MDVNLETGSTGAQAVASTGSGFWDRFPSVNDLVDKLGTIALTRAAYEINKPILRDDRARSSSGLLGNIGTVKVGMDDSTKTILLIAAVAVGIYIVTR